MDINNQEMPLICQDSKKSEPDHKRRRGSLTVEATLSLTTFLFLFMMLYSIVNICRTQAIMGAALHNTAKEISQYTYIYSLTGLHKDISDALDTSVKDDIDELGEGITGVYDNIIQLGDDTKSLTSITETDLTSLIENVNGGVSKLEEDMKSCEESVHNVSETLEKLADDPKSFMIGLAKIGVSDGMNLAKSKLITPPICKGFIKKHLKFSENQSAEEFLKELDIVPKSSSTGISYLDGLDFTSSSLFATKDYDIVLRMEYQIQVIPWLPVDIKVNICQTAITRGWADGDGRHLTFKDNDVGIAEREKGCFKEEPTPSVSTTPTPKITQEERDALDKFYASISSEDKQKYSEAYLIKMYRLYGTDAFDLIKVKGPDAYQVLKAICSQTQYQKGITNSNLDQVVTCIVDTMKKFENKYGSGYAKDNYRADTIALLNQILQYSDAVDIINHYDEDGFYIIAYYGKEGIDYLKEHKKDGVDFILYFGDEWKDKVGIVDFVAYKKVVSENGKGAIDDICKAYPDKWKTWDEETWAYYIDLYMRSDPEKDKDSSESGSKTPSEIARSWQGTGKYPGIDDYVDVTVEKGTVLYRGEPNGTEYFTTLDAIEQSGRDATKLFEGLQVEKNPIHGYRGEMQGYIFNEDVASAYGITNANPQFGKGGLPQYYVPDVQDLIDKGILTPVDNIKLNK
ncbi:MAG: hypothetical protein PUC65_04375 [Clostridiales bacterium]|nr:hypothetical protein [Clostridiales bacterium]